MIESSCGSFIKPEPFVHQKSEPLVHQNPEPFKPGAIQTRSHSSEPGAIRPVDLRNMKFPAARWALVRSPRPDPRPGPGGPPSRSLRTLALTPERIPRFLIPSPAHPARRPSAGSPDVSPGASLRAGPTSRFLRLPASGLGATRRRSGDADTDESTRAAMSLPHVGKVTTPYGFRAVLESSPCCRRRESLFHQKLKTPAVPVTDSPQAEEYPEAREQRSCGTAHGPRLTPR